MLKSKKGGTQGKAIKVSTKRDGSEGKVLKNIMQINRNVWWVLQVRQLNGISPDQPMRMICIS